MKVAHVLWSFKYGGIETMIVDILNEQVKTDKVALFIINDNIDNRLITKIDEKVKIVKVGRPLGSKNPYYPIKLNMQIVGYNPDVIHCHMDGLHRVIKVPYALVRTIHSTHFDIKKNTYYKECTAISKAVLCECEKRGIHATLVLNGIDCDAIKKKEDWSSPKEFHFVQLSRILFCHKGQDVLIRALKKLKDEGIENFKMYFVGEGPDMTELVNLIKDNGLEPNVILEGAKSRDWVYEHMCDFDLFIHPARFEGFGLAVAEACAAKVPVLVSNIEGPMEIINQGKYGMTFESEDVDSLAGRIKEFMQNGYNMDLVEGAYEYTKMNFNVVNTSKMYLDVYKRTLSLS